MKRETRFALVFYRNVVVANAGFVIKYWLAVFLFLDTQAYF